MATGNPHRAQLRLIHRVPFDLGLKVSRYFFPPSTAQISYGESKARRRWSLGSLLNLSNVLTLFWILLLWWGERLIFSSAIQTCSWDRWERWVCLAVACMLMTDIRTSLAMRLLTI